MCIRDRLWSLSLAFTTVWTTTLVAYDERKIEISRSTPLFKEETTIPFQAIKIIKKEKGGTVNYPSYLINIEYFKHDGEINETQVYSGYFSLFRAFALINQQRRYEIFSWC